jgi:hypothetical protein
MLASEVIDIRGRVFGQLLIHLQFYNVMSPEVFCIHKRLSQVTLQFIVIYQANHDNPTPPFFADQLIVLYLKSLYTLLASMVIKFYLHHELYAKTLGSSPSFGMLLFFSVKFQDPSEERPLQTSPGNF